MAKNEEEIEKTFRLVRKLIEQTRKETAEEIFKELDNIYGKDCSSITWLESYDKVKELKRKFENENNN